MAMDGGYSLSDIAAASGGDMGCCNSWTMLILFALIFGWGGNGFGNNGFANAIGYENLATSAEVQRGFDNQNSMANEREILAAVNGNSLQGMQNSNQNTQYITSALNDKYNELQRDIAGIAVGQANILANQNACCSSTKMLIADTASQQRYESLQQMSQLQQLIQSEGAATRSLIQENKIEALQQKINGMEQALNTQMLEGAIQRATAGVVRYPDSFAYNAGTNPFCTCGNVGGCCNV